VTAVAPGIDRGWDRRDAPREPERPEPEPTPRDARWAALLDGLPDAFIEPGATPESIAELRRRLGMPTVEWAEPADRDRVAHRLRELEAEGHGPQRHEGQVTDQQLKDRVLHGYDPAQQGPDKTVNAVTGQPHERPRIATRFDTAEAIVAADDALRASDVFAGTSESAQARGRQSIWVRVPIEEALQPELRAQVTGFERIEAGEQMAVRSVDFTGGRVHAGFHWDEMAETWKTYTIYPDPQRQSDREGDW
jgi:hypothetical protein